MTRATFTTGVACWLSVAVAACDVSSPLDHGQTLFESQVAGHASTDAKGHATHAPFSCAFCHDTSPGDAATLSQPAADGIVRTGYPMGGAAGRASFWGGKTRTLRDAANLCITAFMEGTGYLPDDPDWSDLERYIASLGPAASTAALPMTLPKECSSCPDDTCDLCAPTAAVMGSGDAERGAAVYQRTCSHCHGDFQGRATDCGRIAGAPGLTRDSTSNGFMIAGTTGPSDEDNNISHIAGKIRFGPFSLYGVPGGDAGSAIRVPGATRPLPPGVISHLARFPNMPPYTRERLPVADVVDLLTYFSPILGGKP